MSDCKHLGWSRSADGWIHCPKCKEPVTVSRWIDKINSERKLKAQVRELEGKTIMERQLKIDAESQVRELESENITQAMTIEDLKREIMFMENPQIDGDCYEDEEEEA